MTIFACFQKILSSQFLNEKELGNIRLFLYWLQFEERKIHCTLQGKSHFKHKPFITAHPKIHSNPAASSEVSDMLRAAGQLSLTIYNKKLLTSQRLNYSLNFRLCCWSIDIT